MLAPPDTQFTTWEVEISHLVDVPKRFKTTSVHALKLSIQKIADDRPLSKFGKLTYRYELDDHMDPTVIFVSFNGRGGCSRRFMRLRKVDDAS